MRHNSAYFRSGTRPDSELIDGENIGKSRMDEEDLVSAIVDGMWSAGDVDELNLDLSGLTLSKKELEEKRRATEREELADLLAEEIVEKQPPSQSGETVAKEGHADPAELCGKTLDLLEKLEQSEAL